MEVDEELRGRLDALLSPEQGGPVQSTGEDNRGKEGKDLMEKRRRPRRPRLHHRHTKPAGLSTSFPLSAALLSSPSPSPFPSPSPTLSFIGQRCSLAFPLVTPPQLHRLSTATTTATMKGTLLSSSTVNKALQANINAALILVGGFGTRLRPLVRLDSCCSHSVLDRILQLTSSRHSLFPNRWSSLPTNP